MPNKAYEYGRRKEYESMQYLRDQGHIVFRTAGSHGSFDLICVEGEDCKVRFIQIKATRGASRTKNWKALFEATPPLPESVLYDQELWLYDGDTKTWDRSCVI